MSWTFLPAKQYFGKFVHIWDELNGDLFQNHPLLDSRFVGPLVEYFANQRVRLAIHRTDGHIDSMLLLTPRDMGVWTSFLPSQAQIAPIILSTHANLGDLFTQLPGPNLMLDICCQDPRYSALPTNHNSAYQEIAPHAITLDIKIEKDFESFWGSRSRKLQANMRRYFRRLENKNIESRLEIATQGSAIEDALVRYGDVEIQGWKGRAGTAIHKDNIQGRFYRDVLLRFAKNQQTIIYELYLNDRFAASQLAISNDHTLIRLKITYDESLAKYAPGRVLDYLMLEREFARKQFAIYEYNTNAIPDQLSWGTGKRVISHVSIYRFPWLKYAARVARSIRKSLKMACAFSSRAVTLSRGSQPACVSAQISSVGIPTKNRLARR